MSSIFLIKLFSRTLLAAGLAAQPVVFSAQAALPAPIFENPPHQSTEVSASPILTWSRGTVELLVNGGFESGDFNGWQSQTINGFGGMEIDDGTVNPNGPDGPTPPLEGQFGSTLSAFFFGGGGFFELSQQVVIPAGLTDLTLTWSHLIRNYGDEFSNDQPFQYFRVEIRNTQGNVLDTLYSTQPGDVVFDDLNDIDPVAYFNWQKVSANLDAYAGQTIRLVFITRNQQENMNVRLDRMSLTGRASAELINEVYLSLNPIPGGSDFLGTTMASSWPLEDLQPNTTYYWRLIARQGAETQTGPVWRFRTSPIGAPDRFLWDSPPTAAAGEPFTVTLAARDSHNHHVNGVSGTAHLGAVALNTSSPHRLLQNESPTALNEFAATTVGYSFTPSSDLWVQSLRSLTSGKISLWTDIGLRLASVTVAGPDGSWKEATLDPPLSLLAGRTYRLGVHAGSSTRFFNRFDGASAFPHGNINQGYLGDGDGFPTQPHPAQWWMVNLEYLVAQPFDLTVTPSATGTFASGLWTGPITLPQAGGQVVLLAEQDGGAKGYSDPITFAGSLDDDNDGIPNQWETENGLDPDDPSDAGMDTDGDGHTNLEEYLAGTDPNDEDSVLRVLVETTGGLVTLQFQAQANRSYSVLYTAAIGQAAWTKLEDIAAGEERLVTVTDPASITGIRFYRVVTPSQ